MSKRMEGFYEEMKRQAVYSSRAKAMLEHWEATHKPAPLRPEPRKPESVIEELKTEHDALDEDTQPSGAGTGCEQKTVPAFIQNLPPKLAGKVFTVEKDSQGGIKKTITPEALKERMKLFIGEKK